MLAILLVELGFNGKESHKFHAFSIKIVQRLATRPRASHPTEPQKSRKIGHHKLIELRI